VVLAFARRLEHQLLHGGSDAERAIRQKLKADLTKLLKEEAVSVSVSIKFEVVLAFASAFFAGSSRAHPASSPNKCTSPAAIERVRMFCANYNDCERTFSCDEA
jgi:hypothetical protein